MMSTSEAPLPPAEAPEALPSSTSYGFRSTLGDAFEEKVAHILQSTQTTQSLRHRASSHISSWSQSIPTPAILQVDLRADKLLHAFLSHSTLIGTDSERYTAAAILACDSRSSLLLRLASFWLSHFLWPFKANSNRRTLRSISDLTTPASTPAPLSAPHPTQSDRDDLFASKVVSRDGGRCIVTTFWDSKYGNPPEGNHTWVVSLEAARIINSAHTVNLFNDDRQPSPTADIFHHYCRIPRHTISQFDQLLDDPQNGLTLQWDVRYTFNEYRWCLVQQDKPNTYKVQQFDSQCIKHLPHEFITFTDHSASSSPIPLPSPSLLHLHSTISHLLHHSGVGKVLDIILKEFDEIEYGCAREKVRTPDDLGPMMVALELLPDENVFMNGF